jgi:predicted MFS family arabinose efflux permease
MLAGLQMSLGMIGTLLATAPLALSAATIGWRASFLIIAAITCCIGTAIFFSLADESSGQPSTGRHSRKASPESEQSCARPQWGVSS